MPSIVVIWKAFGRPSGRPSEKRNAMLFGVNYKGGLLVEEGLHPCKEGLPQWKAFLGLRHQKSSPKLYQKLARKPPRGVVSFGATFAHHFMIAEGLPTAANLCGVFGPIYLPKLSR